MIDAACSTEMSPHAYETISRNIPELCHFHTYCCENLQYNILFILYISKYMFWIYRTHVLRFTWLLL